MATISDRDSMSWYSRGVGSDEILSLFHASPPFVSTSSHLTPHPGSRRAPPLTSPCFVAWLPSLLPYLDQNGDKISKIRNILVTTAEIAPRSVAMHSIIANPTGAHINNKYKITAQIPSGRSSGKSARESILFTKLSLMSTE